MTNMATAKATSTRFSLNDWKLTTQKKSNKNTPAEWKQTGITTANVAKHFEYGEKVLRSTRSLYVETDKSTCCRGLKVRTKQTLRWCCFAPSTQKKNVPGPPPKPLTLGSGEPCCVRSVVFPTHVPISLHVIRNMYQRSNGKRTMCNVFFNHEMSQFCTDSKDQNKPVPCSSSLGNFASLL